ncbi:hypothetical protein J2S17_005668 [Cytobacillus purgationiresistens]|uniref:Uncharacterized protein n=1 Tax=Cytobacillus purgationiresistens TaxID=863449 RepID=A0ABU0AR27_9BACI|nr:hypothetical protein [Cytobacillus purgationiresistens]
MQQRKDLKLVLPHEKTVVIRVYIKKTNQDVSTQLRFLFHELGD